VTAQMGAEHVTDRLLHKSVSEMAAQMGAERVTDRLLYLSDGASQVATDRARPSREIERSLYSSDKTAGSSPRRTTPNAPASSDRTAGSSPRRTTPNAPASAGGRARGHL
jgi:hypothetical protein